MFWHVEQRDARYPLDCWKDVKLLLTDTPGPGATDDQIILEALGTWRMKMAEGGTMLIYSHVGYWPAHSEYQIGNHKKYIERHTEPGDLVADPFCGRSALGVAALSLGRSFIGTDIQRTQIEASFNALKEA
jgi:hypothetical protein